MMNSYFIWFWKPGRYLTLYLDFANLLIYLNQTKGEHSLPILVTLSCTGSLENTKIHFSGCRMLGILCCAFPLAVLGTAVLPRQTSYLTYQAQNLCK